MTKKDLAIFEGHRIRRIYDEKAEIWWFSVVDIIQVLTQQADYQASRKYWKVLKGRLAKEGNELVSNCYQLKMAAADGKMLLTATRREFAERFSKTVCAKKGVSRLQIVTD